MYSLKMKDILPLLPSQDYLDAPTKSAPYTANY